MISETLSLRLRLAACSEANRNGGVGSGHLVQPAEPGRGLPGRKPGRYGPLQWGGGAPGAVAAGKCGAGPGLGPPYHSNPGQHHSPCSRTSPAAPLSLGSRARSGLGPRHGREPPGPGQLGRGSAGRPEARIASAAAFCPEATASSSAVRPERSRRPTRPAQERERRKSTTAT
jgi:hypothetical protein